MYQKAIDSWWHPRGIPLHTDIEEWGTSLSTAEKHLLSRVMAFFASSNCVITDKATNSLSVEYSNLEAKFFFDLQTARYAPLPFSGSVGAYRLIRYSENIHAETYAHLLKNLIEDDRQRDDILNSSTMLSSVLEQNAWANKWLRRDYGSIGNRVTAMICVKGIFFQSMFAVLCWFRSQGKLPGLTRTNDLIMKDSAMHAYFGYHMLSLIEDRPGRDLTTKIVKEAVKIEVRFIESERILFMIVKLLVTRFQRPSISSSFLDLNWRASYNT